MLKQFAQGLAAGAVMFVPPLLAVMWKAGVFA
jgi:hypothetical protein